MQWVSWLDYPTLPRMASIGHALEGPGICGVEYVFLHGHLSATSWGGSDRILLVAELHVVVEARSVIHME